MRTISATTFRAHIGQIVDAASSGERIVIERNHKPIAVLVPYQDKARLEGDERRSIQRSAGPADRLEQ